MDIYVQLKNKIGELAQTNQWLKTPIEIKAKALSTKEAIGSPDHNDFPIQRGKERLMQATFKGAAGQAFTDHFGNFQGTVQDILSLPLENNLQRALLVASLNAMLGHLGRINKTIHCHDNEPVKCSQELFASLHNRFPKAKITQIGFQPRMVEALKPFSSRIIDLDPDNIGTEKFGRIIEGPEATEEALGWADLLLVTGSTLVNGTIGTFLIGKPVIFYGTTVAGAAELFNWERFCVCGHS
jgi:hypothetical protein